MRWLSGWTKAVSVTTPAASASCARCASMIVAMPRPCHASRTAKASSARSASARARSRHGRPRARRRPAVATRPTPWSMSRCAARSEEMPPPMKRNQRASSDSPSRNAATASTSAVTWVARGPWSRRAGRRQMAPSRRRLELDALRGFGEGGRHRRSVARLRERAVARSLGPGARAAHPWRAAADRRTSPMNRWSPGPNVRTGILVPIHRVTEEAALPMFARIVVGVDCLHGRARRACARGSAAARGRWRARRGLRLSVRPHGEPRRGGRGRSGAARGPARRARARS